jgi:coenzyme F420 hydrogenase subunit beta
MRFETVRDFFDTIEKYPHLCTSCGMCAGICPTAAVKIVKNQYSQYIPLFEEDKCNACNQCINCCPGIDITYAQQAGIGAFQKIFLANSNDNAQRSAGSSGGVITALSAWMLSEGIVGKAIMLNSTASAVEPEIGILTSAEEIMQCIGSKYVAYPTCEAIRDFREKTLITALPCQARAIKKARRNKGYVFGLFCSKAFTSDLIRYVSIQESIKLDEIQQINYRDGGWPGQVAIDTKSQKIRIPYNRSYFTAISNGFFFAIQGCLLCPDYFNENADISFGDPWGFKPDQELLLGKTIVIARTVRGLELIERAIANKIIVAEEITERQVIKGHQGGSYLKKRSLDLRLKKYKEMGLPLPEHNLDLTKKHNLLQSYIQNYYIKNNVLLKKNYAKIFSSNKLVIFVKRYFILLLQKIDLNLSHGH